MSLVLGFDFGTGGVRAGVFDAATKTTIACADASYETRYPRPGWAEQSPADWIVAMKQAGCEAVASSGRSDIAGVCVATTASTVAIVDKTGSPVTPAILWMDCRATQEALDTAKIYHPVMKYCGGSDSVEWLLPKAMWLSRNAPEVYRRADVICEAIDFINYHLTGEWVGSRMNAACKWNWNSATGQFAPELYAAFGVPDLIEKLPLRIVPVGDAIGRMHPQMAADLGISGSPLVAQGGIDAHIGMLGAGTVEEGGMLMIGGTSIVQLVQLGQHADMSGFWGPYPNALVDDLWLVEAGQVSAGSVLNWLSSTIFGLEQLCHSALIQEAMSKRAGGSGLLTLDYWMGNRTPYRDGALRGAILGLTLGHGRADIYASAVDAIALGSANVTTTLKERGVQIDRIVIAGGICHNPLWLQSSVDALGQTAYVAQDDNLTIVGTAICALNALESAPNLRLAAQEYTVTGRAIEPDPKAMEWYQEELGAYRAATDELTPWMHKLTESQLHKPGLRLGEATT